MGGALGRAISRGDFADDVPKRAKKRIVVRLPRLAGKPVVWQPIMPLDSIGSNA